MQTRILSSLRQTAEGKTAEAILRRCVHCGFCNATCPTYQLLGDENDGPRGRIYLIKQLMEGQLENAPDSGRKTLQHLDRCLLCRSCETTCPSGVEYSKLLDIGRHLAEEHTGRDRADQSMRKRLRKYLPKSGLFNLGLKLGRAFKPMLPDTVAGKITASRPAGEWPKSHHGRRMLVLEGCVQPSLSPDINAATARVLDKLGISLITAPKAGCCGAVSQHLGAPEEALDYMRRNIDAWWPYIANGVEAIITTASGCGVMVKEYKYHLRGDLEYSIKAERISNLCRDIAEVIAQEKYQRLASAQPERIAWHPPCTLQHGQKIRGVVENILTDCGYVLVPVADEHLCCGSAGTYSILQPEISRQLRSNKLANLTQHQPEMIVTANIGCQTHLQEASKIPVVHWIHLLDKKN
ncbi:glycolate oxidase subunit GlcF [Candidatus Thiothrix sp. Deng01]|uniref:Glycolate oxidase iron-sulfur subunit n=1 Tax=Candidatus Thiothrix phosphatis TaxID=3112415 RepID=A0ABU6D0N2_9GAMM|nr:glycolate oxidase subunit GlcF [Candidatus Thiothrix sp. Deng01]MEB4591907.1 glycolate oxidase subunit GlcF [Candidatus Thiothrix sp. Deng01]